VPNRFVTAMVGWATSTAEKPVGPGFESTVECWNNDH
jgi:hypothetical protein